MRIAKRNWVLAAVWILLSALWWATGGAGIGEQGREVGRLFPDFRSDQVARVVLERGGSQPGSLEIRGTALTSVVSIEAGGATEGASAEVERTWALPGHFDHAANSATVQRLFDAVSSLTNLDLLSEDPALHADYGVGAEALNVRLFGPGDQLLAAFVQGDDASTGSGLASYVRPLGEDSVYRAPRVGPIPLDPYYWLDRRWLAFVPARVREVHIEQEGRSSSYARTDLERWSHDGQPVSARVMRAFLDRLGALFFDEVVDARPGTRTATLTLRLVLQDGDELRMSFADPAAEGTREAWLGSDEHVVRFSASTATLVSKSLRGLEEGR